MTRFVYAAIISFFLSVGAFAQPIVVFDDLATDGNPYSVNSASWRISSIGSGLDEPAFSFIPGVTTNFAQLDIALLYPNGLNEPNSAIVDLVSDSSDSPGTVLQSWNVANLPNSSICCTLTTLTGDGTIPLVEGSKYWVAVLPSSDSSLILWAWNTTGVNTSCCSNGVPALLYNHGSGWGPADKLYGYPNPAPAPAFEVLGTASPEPGTMALALFATALILVLWVKKSFAASRAPESGLLHGDQLSATRASRPEWRSDRC